MDGTGAGELFRQGRLEAAIDAATEDVRRDPLDAGGRIFLAELLLFADELARADAVLEAASAVDPGVALVIAEFRQLLRAATACRQMKNDGRVPDFLGGPTESQSHLLRALTALRAGDFDAASKEAEAAEATRPRVHGARGRAAFDDLRDADDLAGGCLDVLTTTGKHFWLPVERIDTLEVHKPVRARDLFWCRCSMTVHGGPDGDVYIPALYDCPTPVEDALRLGRSTDWTQSSPVRGSGRRVYLVGDEGVPIHELGSIEFD